jgi:heat shock protein HslJ
VQGTRIKVEFGRRLAGQAQMGWQAGCNGSGAKVRATADELHIRHITSTLIGCSANRERQDEWLSEFFASDPRWRLRHNTLTLTSGETDIQLQQRSR